MSRINRSSVEIAADMGRLDGQRFLDTGVTVRSPFDSKSTAPTLAHALSVAYTRAYTATCRRRH
jgi:hypothetical protein